MEHWSFDAERQRLRSHAERGNDQRSISSTLRVGAWLSTRCVDQRQTQRQLMSAADQEQDADREHYRTEVERRSLSRKASQAPSHAEHGNERIGVVQWRYSSARDYAEQASLD